MKTISRFCILSVTATLVLAKLDVSKEFLYLAAGAATAVITCLLFRLYRISTFLTETWEPLKLVYLRAHLLLHFVLILYQALQLDGSSDRLRDWIFMPFLALFFYTGMRVWKEQFVRYGWIPYRLFYLGNRQFLFLLPALFLLGIIYPTLFWAKLFPQLFTAYCAGHFLIFGFVVQKMENNFTMDSPLRPE